MGDTPHPPAPSPSSLTALAGADAGRFSRRGFAAHWRRDSCWDKPHQPPLPTQTPIQPRPAPQQVWPGGTGQHRGRCCHIVTKQNQLCQACHQPSGTSLQGGSPMHPETGDRGPLPHQGSAGLPGEGGGSCPRSCPHRDRCFPTQQRAPPGQADVPVGSGTSSILPGLGDRPPCTPEGSEEGETHTWLSLGVSRKASAEICCSPDLEMVLKGGKG